MTMASTALPTGMMSRPRKNGITRCSCGHICITTANALPSRPSPNRRTTLTASKRSSKLAWLINKIYQAADTVHDYRTMQCFDWFVKEQGEEEKNADDLIKKYKMFGSDAKGLYALNQELLARTYVAPTLVL